MKLEALAVRQVTQELKTHSIWSWGWATFSEAGIDQDKSEAVCVYLWVRDQNICSGPGAAGPDFDPSLTVGQLNLSEGVLCTLPAGQIRSVAVDPLARAIGDRDIAASLVLERLVLQQEVELDARAVLAGELAFVDDHFHGNLSAYLAALRRIPLSRSAARGLLLDELRRDAVRARFTPARPGGHQISEFHLTYGGLRARLVETARPVAWLGGRTRGIAIETFAPTRVFSLARRGYVRTIHGRIEVRPLDDTVFLGTIPIADARLAIEASLNRFARVYAYEAWLAKAEARALAEAICTADELPTSAVLTLDDLLPVVTAPVA